MLLTRKCSKFLEQCVCHLQFSPIKSPTSILMQITSFSKGCAIGTCQSRWKFLTGDFCVPFVQAVDQPVFPGKWQTTSMRWSNLSSATRSRNIACVPSISVMCFRHTQNEGREQKQPHFSRNQKMEMLETWPKQAPKTQSFSQECLANYHILI